MLIMHSFGGLTGTGAVQGLRPQDRDNGAGILKQITLCAFVYEEGMSALGSTGGHHVPGVIYRLADPEVLHECTPEVQREKVAKLRLFNEATMPGQEPYSG